jgi:hypothetical protein
MASLKLLLSLLVASVLAARGRRGGRRASSSSTEYTTDDTTYTSLTGASPIQKKNYFQQWHHVPVLADVGFYAFEFGKKNQPVKTTFHFILQRPAYFTVTDCFCEGDSFKFIDNQASAFTTNVNCPLGPYKCRNYESDPWKCLNNGKFCTGNAYMGVGAHNITITATNSVSGGGTAFARLDTLCEDPMTRQLYLCCTTGDQCIKTIYQS